MASKALRLLGNADSGIATGLVAVALIAVLGSSLYDLRDAQTSLEKTIDQQEVAIRANRKIEVQLEALAKGTRILADRGNPNATKILSILRQNGININGGGS